MKKTNFVIIALTVLLIITIVVASVNIIAMAQIKKITYGMSAEEVKDALGDRDSASGSGFVRNEWKLANGDILVIWFDVSEETGESYVSGYFVE